MGLPAEVHGRAHFSANPPNPQPCSSPSELLGYFLQEFMKTMNSECGIKLRHVNRQATRLRICF